MRFKKNLLISALFSIFIPTLTFPQESINSDTERTFLAAELVEKPELKWPTRAMSARGVEGWALLNFVVNEAGEVSDVFVEDSRGDEGLVEEAVNTIYRAKYLPATLNGEPTSQGINRSLYKFVEYSLFDNTGRGVRTEFQNKYNEVRQLIENQDLDATSIAIEELVSIADRNEEWAWANWIYYNYMEAASSFTDALKISKLEEAVKITSRDNKAQLNPDEYVIASNNLLLLQFNSGDISAAISTINLFNGLADITASQYYERVKSTFDLYAAEIQSIIQSERLLSYQGIINERGHWIHSLTRSNLVFTEISGQIESSQVRCDLGLLSIEISVNNLISLPDDRGNCILLLTGSEGTNVIFHELSELYLENNSLL